MGLDVFFSSAEAYLSDKYPRVFKKKGGTKASSSISLADHWNLIIFDVARDNVFSQPSLTPSTSVEKTNLYTFLDYLDTKAIVAETDDKQRQANAAKLRSKRKRR